MNLGDKEIHPIRDDWTGPDAHQVPDRPSWAGQTVFCEKPCVGMTNSTKKVAGILKAHASLRVKRDPAHKD